MNKAIIIGAGVAGPVLAIQLQSLGYDVEIFEARSQENLDEGLFIGLSPNGLNVLKKFVDIDYLKRDYATGSMNFYNENNKLIASFDNGYQKEKFGSETIQVKRSDLSEVVKNAALGKDIKIHYEKKCIHVNETNHSVTVTFNDGDVRKADLVFGADGVFSAVRNLVFPSSGEPVYNKNISTGGYARLPQMSKPLPATHMIFGQRGFFAYNVSNKGEVWWFNNYYRREEPQKGEMQSVLEEEIVQNLLQIHKNDPPVITEILRASYRYMAYPIYDIPTLRQWHTSRVCLLGDAAHAVAPHSGQGASLALEDTVCIANCLAEEQQPANAFARYQTLRKLRVEKIIKSTRKIGNQKSKPGLITRWFRDRMLNFFIQKTIQQTEWIYGYTV